MWRARGYRIDLARPRVMGIVNVTPDSFSEGGRYARPEDAIERAQELVAQGADLLDVGGESTRPGATPVNASEELRRVLPVAREATRLGAPVSIDTYKPEVAEAALEAGASIVNDVTGLARPEMASVVSKWEAGIVILHMRGSPPTMQQEPRYEDVVAEVSAFLADRTERALAAGIDRASIAVDPGIGFGKGVRHNLALLRGIPQIASLGFPVLVGVSRKSFLGQITGTGVRDRLPAGIAATLFAIERGARLVRTHDVLETIQAIRVAVELRKEEPWTGSS